MREIKWHGIAEGRIPYKRGDTDTTTVFLEGYQWLTSNPASDGDHPNEL